MALQALAYATKLYAEVTAKHDAPTLGLQNQAVHLILADPICVGPVPNGPRPRASKASAKPSQRLPHDELYRRVREYLEKVG